MRTASIVLAAVVSSLVTLLAFQLVGGSPATARNAAAEGNIGICDIATLLEDMMDSDRYLPDRQAKEVELQQEILLPIQERGQELQNAFNQAQQSGDQAAQQQIMQQVQQFQQDSQAAQQRFSEAMQDFVSGQFKDAYAIIRESADAIGGEMGFEYVAVSVPPTKTFEDASLPELLTELLSRTFITFPDGVDITPDVRDDLNLEESLDDPAEGPIGR